MWSRFLGLLKGTKAELSLETAICRLGVPYRFQQPIWRYFIDFTLPTLMVAIEVDGSSHDGAEQQRKDEERTAWLRKKGWTVVRCRNEDAVCDPVGTVNRLMHDAGLPYRVELPAKSPTNLPEPPAK